MNYTPTKRPPTTRAAFYEISRFRPIAEIPVMSWMRVAVLPMDARRLQTTA